MLRPTIFKTLRPIVRSSPVITRPLSITAGRMAGETGGTRSGGEAASDAFQKREKAGEDFYVKRQEKEKLLALKDKLRQQKAHLDDLDKHIDDLTQEIGGDHKQG